MNTTKLICNVPRLLRGLALASLLHFVGVSDGLAATTLFFDDFQSYAVTNNAPNPLPNGPAGGQWVYVDPVPPLVVGEHQIFASAAGTGSGLNSRVWGSATNNARLTNAISLAGLPSTNLYTFRLSFVVAADTLTAARTITFNYDISSSAGSLTFISGHNLDDSQTFSSLTGSGIASSTTKGKTPDRQFEFVFQSSSVTTADKIIFDITRITNNAGATLTLFLDDVRLTVEDGVGPTVQSARSLQSLSNVRIKFSEPLNAASATNLSNYSFAANTLSVVGATLLDSTTVDLTTSGQTPSSTHGLQISGLQGLTGSSMVSTQISITAPALSISTVRYDAGTTTTQPSGPPDPISAAAGYWVTVTNLNSGMTFGPVTDDQSTGFNAWRITDQNSLGSGGVINYTIPVDQASDNLARSNGWRLMGRVRLTDNFFGTAGDHVLIYGDALTNIRYGVLFGINASDNLFATVLGGLTYTLTTDGSARNYHTHIISYDPVTATASYYFDGRLICADYIGQSGTGNNGVIFGSGSSTGTGEMNYNLVQLDVVGATQPVVTLNPQGGSYGVGQKVTFTAGFSPWVNGYQWLSNGVIIAGATTTNYTTGFISSGYSGSQYSCRALCALGNVETAAATLNVTDDTNPPVLLNASASLLFDRIQLTFSEPVIDTYATNIANYTWLNGGITNISARLLDPLTVELRAGPFASLSNYTVRVSNVRDTSNLIIATNSPATVTFQHVTSAARYDAGNTTNAPAGPMDPVTPEGGSWIPQIGSNVDISTNAVVNDLGIGLNAWQVRDATTATGQFVSYSKQLATNLQDNARQFGWVLTARSRLAENFGGVNSAMFALYEDYRFDRYGLIFGHDANNDLIVGTSTTAGFTTNVLTTGGTALDSYHLHQVTYDPVSHTASYYFDGNLIAWRFPVSNPANSLAEIVWGARASAAKGTMNYNLVDFSIMDGPLLNIVINGANVDLSYRGILESANLLASPTVWTPIATNNTGGTFSAPLNSQTQRYFRTRMP